MIFLTNFLFDLLLIDGKGMMKGLRGGHIAGVVVFLRNKQIFTSSI